MKGRQLAGKFTEKTTLKSTPRVWAVVEERRALLGIPLSRFYRRAAVILAANPHLWDACADLADPALVREVETGEAGDAA